LAGDPGNHRLYGRLIAADVKKNSIFREYPAPQPTVDKRAFPGTGFSIEDKVLVPVKIPVDLLDLEVSSEKDILICWTISIQEFEGVPARLTGLFFSLLVKAEHLIQAEFIGRGLVFMAMFAVRHSFLISKRFIWQLRLKNPARTLGMGIRIPGILKNT
jgi:hypothetical protein